MDGHQPHIEASDKRSYRGRYEAGKRDYLKSKFPSFFDAEYILNPSDLCKALSFLDVGQR
jgi:hypothetical protein